MLSIDSSMQHFHFEWKIHKIIPHKLEMKAKTIAATWKRKKNSKIKINGKQNRMWSAFNCI